MRLLLRHFLLCILHPLLVLLLFRLLPLRVQKTLQDSNGTNELLHVESKSVRRWCIEARALSTVFQLHVDDRPPIPVLIRELQVCFCAAAS